MHQEYLLSDNKEHEDLFESFLADLNLWRSSIIVDQKLQHRAKSFSNMIESCYIFFYDHPTLLEQYPYGFHTKNMIFISTKQYQKMLELEPVAVVGEEITGYWNLAGLLVIPSFIQMIEEKHPVVFSNEEIKKIIASLCSDVFFPREYISHSKKEYNLNDYIPMTENKLINVMNDLFEYHRPEFITHQELVSIAINLKLNSVNFLQNIDEDNNFIDYALLNNAEIYDKNHPFSRLITHVKMPNSVIDILDFEEKSIKMHDFLKIHSYQLYSAFNTLSYQIVKESDDIQTLLKKLDGAWLNTACKCPTDVFGQAIEILYKNCLIKFSKDKLTLKNDVVNKIAHFINEHDECYPDKRRELIDKITQHLMSISTVRAVPLKSRKP